jgi:hypothetical protein
MKYVGFKDSLMNHKLIDLKFQRIQIETNAYFLKKDEIINLNTDQVLISIPSREFKLINMYSIPNHNNQHVSKSNETLPDQPLLLSDECNINYHELNELIEKAYEDEIFQDETDEDDSSYTFLGEKQDNTETYIQTNIKVKDVELPKSIKSIFENKYRDQWLEAIKRDYCTY